VGSPACTINFFDSVCELELITMGTLLELFRTGLVATILWSASGLANIVVVLLGCIEVVLCGRRVVYVVGVLLGSRVVYVVGVLLGSKVVNDVGVLLGSRVAYVVGVLLGSKDVYDVGVLFGSRVVYVVGVLLGRMETEFG